MAITRPQPATTVPHTTFEPVPRRPQLIWNGRDRRRMAEPVPAQTLEIVRPRQEAVVARGTSAPQLQWEETAPAENRLIWTNDNLVALTSLLYGDEQHAQLEGQVDLIYIDPPFAVQNNFSINVEIENGLSDEKLPSLIEELAYRDTWQDGLDSYLSMMRDRLELLKRLLKPTGSIYIHCDWHAGHYLKVLMDEVFGYENFQNQIVWQRTTAHSDTHGYGQIQDLLLYYTVSEQATFNHQYQPYSDSYIASHYTYVDTDPRDAQRDDTR